MITMKEGNARLLMLAGHLRNGKMGHKIFDFATWNSPQEPRCGTAGCAIGECPIVWPEEWGWDSNGGPGICSQMRTEVVVPGVTSRGTPRGEPGKVKANTLNSTMDFFGITEEEAYHLFIPDNQIPSRYSGQTLGFRATKEQVAANIEAFVKQRKKKK